MPTKRKTKSPPTKPTLNSTVKQLVGVGDQLCDKLNRLGIEKVEDLLWHQPARFEDRSTLYTPKDAPEDLPCLFAVQVIEARHLQHGKASLVAQAMTLDAQLHPTGETVTIWFFGRFAPNFTPRQTYYLFGTLQTGRDGLEIAQPELINRGQGGEILPVYPSAAGLHQKKIRNLVDQALTLAVTELSDPLPIAVRTHFKWPALLPALQRLHVPKSRDGIPDRDEPALTRLITEEFAAHIIGLKQRRATARQRRAPNIPAAPGLFQQLMQHLHFTATKAQQRVIAEIRDDIASQTPMLRLVQGDVGSGKTLVAAAVALDAIASGRQVALMAPTAILAEQHAANFAHWLTPMGYQVALLGGQQKKRQRETILSELGDGTIHLAIGTHALFQDEVRFARLGLVIVDEQHRFGVHQRLMLSDKGAGTDPEASVRPHQLIMTATPIPRTLAMTRFADLDVSVIDERPPGRTPVTTALVAARRRDEVIKRISTVCAQQRQAYWVCPLIEQGSVEAQAAQATYTHLIEQLPHLRIGLVHGRMKPEEKQLEMTRFSRHELDLLVATTVIEVGVDVPNASLMIIENAERMGLAQLHQLRGRVGRGATASHCVLLFDEPLTDRARARLALMRQTEDGFVLAEADLAQRGPGEVLGTRQAGLARLKFANLQTDQRQLTQAQSLAELLIEHHPFAAEALVRRWLGVAGQYAQV